MAIIPLFPLRNVLLPHGRMALQVFEPRYLDLVSGCLKGEHDGGFGVVWLREGSEVYHREIHADNRLAQVGTFARIVDWDSLPNGLLGLTIEGGRKFRLLSSYQQSNHLYMAEVEWLEDEPYIALPRQSEELKGLLEQLLEHPHIVRLRFDSQVTDVASLGCILAQLLPIPETIKFQLLALVDPMQRLQALIDLMDEISQ